MIADATAAEGSHAVRSRFTQRPRRNTSSESGVFEIACDQGPGSAIEPDRQVVRVVATIDYCLK
jgi:hypothetical protein